MSASFAGRLTRGMVAGLLAVLLTGCGSRESARPAHPLPAPPFQAAGEPGRSGGEFVLSLSSNPRTFNPLLAFDAASDAVTRLLHSSLIRLDWTTQEIVPGLAHSWSVAPDQKTWTFNLRRGLHWSDGAPLTAADVVFTWNEVMYDREFNRLTPDLFRIQGKPFEVTAPDELTVRVVTPEVFGPFLEFFGSVAILPKHLLEPAVKQGRFASVLALNSTPARVVGCGPFRLKEFVPDKHVRLERNPEYWAADRAGNRLPYFETVRFAIDPSPGSDTVLFLAGKTHALDALRFEAVERCEQAATQCGVRVLDLGAGVERDFLWFNQNTGTNAAGRPLVAPAKLRWFRNQTFRQAVSCAIDRARIVREACAGRAQPIHTFIGAENRRWSNPAVPVFEFNLERARALLAEVGLLDRDGDGVREDAQGVPVEIQMFCNTGNPFREKAAALIAEDLRHAGLKLNTAAISFRELVEKINVTFDYECALMGLGGGGLDPASQLNVLRSSEDLHQWFPRQSAPSTPWEARLDALMDAQMRTLDFAERKRAFDEVQMILAEQLPMIYILSPVAYAGVRAEIGNVRPSALTPYRVTWNLEELFFRSPSRD